MIYKKELLLVLVCFVISSCNISEYKQLKIDNGKYTIKFMVIGYASLEEEIVINNQNIRLDVELQPQAVNVDEIKVSAERMRFEKKVDISRINLTNRDIRRAPAFIESDVFRTGKPLNPKGRALSGTSPSSTILFIIILT